MLNAYHLKQAVTRHVSPPSPHPRRWVATALTIVALSVVTIAGACDLPVFRWALENWAADPYEIIIFTEGELDGDGQALVEHLRSGTTEADGLANATTTVVDTTQSMDPFFTALLENQSTPTFPWMVVRYPHAQPNPAYVWSGTLNADHIARLLDSPARQEIAKRLSEDNTAVWVFLKTGDVKRDAGRQENLQAALDFKWAAWPGFRHEEAEPVAWALHFSMITIDRNDPAEQPFIQMLLKSEGDLNDTDAPMAFPVFGRGRALYALVDGGIASDLVEEACMYIAGRCTCEVKDLNPGIDLLMSTDWDTVMGDSMMTPIEPPSVAELAMAQTAPQDEATPPTATASTPNAPSRSLVRNIVIAMVIGFVLVIVGTIVILIKMPNRNE